MDEQPRGSEMPRGGIRKFMNDPKSSVMSYLAENMAAQHIQQQLQQQPHGSSGKPPGSSPYGQQFNNQGSSGPPSQFQSHNNASQSSLAQSIAGQNGIMPQSYSPQNSNPQKAQNTQTPPVTPYIASNVASSMGRPSEAYNSAPTGNPQSQQQIVQTQNTSQPQSSDISMTSLGKLPPTSGSRHSTMSQSAPRLYHRMVLEFEDAKNTYFKAKSQHNSQEMTSAAYDLESVSRRIWSLRYEHAWEFDGFQESGHQAVIASWQAQYELWADTVLDIQEGDSAASMFAVHRTSSIGGQSLAEAPSINAMAPTSAVSTNNNYGQLQQPSFPGMSVNSPSQAPPQAQQSLDSQPMSVGQNMPINQNMQSPPTPPQYMPPSGMPGGYTSTDMPPPGNSASQQIPPFQQQSFSPPPQQPGIGQGMMPPSQNLHSATGPGVPNGQNLPPNSQPNMQQRLPEQPFPQKMPPQGLPPQGLPPQGPPPQGPPLQRPPPQQMQGGPANMQQSQYMNQRPPPGPPYNNTMPPSPMPQMQSGQNPSPRPNPSMPQSLQPGGRMNS